MKSVATCWGCIFDSGFELFPENKAAGFKIEMGNCGLSPSPTQGSKAPLQEVKVGKCAANGTPQNDGTQSMIEIALNGFQPAAGDFEVETHAVGFAIDIGFGQLKKENQDTVGFLPCVGRAFSRVGWRPFLLCERFPQPRAKSITTSCEMSHHLARAVQLTQ